MITLKTIGKVFYRRDPISGEVFVGITYNWGEQADKTIQCISGNLNLRAYGFTAGLSSQIQWHNAQIRLQF